MESLPCKIIAEAKTSNDWKNNVNDFTEIGLKIQHLDWPSRVKIFNLTTDEQYQFLKQQDWIVRMAFDQSFYCNR